jgi:hypothetical protein
VAVAALEGLDGGLAVDHGRDDVAVLGVGLLADDHPVAVGDRGVDHRVADDLEHEQRAAADQLAGEREDVLDGLLGQHGAAGGDAPDDRDVGRLRAGGAGGGLVVVLVRDGQRRRRGERSRRDADVDGARPAGVAAQEALLLQGGELVADAAGAGQPDRLADLAHGGRVAPALHRLADDLEHLALARGQARPRRAGRRAGRAPWPGARPGRRTCRAVRPPVMPPRPLACHDGPPPASGAQAARPVITTERSPPRSQIKHVFERVVELVGPRGCLLAQTFDRTRVRVQAGRAAGAEERP